MRERAPGFIPLLRQLYRIVLRPFKFSYRASWMIAAECDGFGSAFSPTLCCRSHFFCKSMRRSPGLSAVGLPTTSAQHIRFAQVYLLVCSDTLAIAWVVSAPCIYRRPTSFVVAFHGYVVILDCHWASSSKRQFAPLSGL